MTVDRIGFVRLEGARDGDTAWLPRLPATIGSDPDADVIVPAVAARHAVVFERDGSVVLLDSGSAQGTYLAGQLVQEAILRPGDVIELGPGGPRLRFERNGPPNALARAHDPLRAEPPLDTLPPSGPLSQTLILRTMTHSSHAFRRLVAGAAVLGLLLLGWTWRENRRFQAELERLRDAMGQVDAERRALEQRVDAERHKEEHDRLALEQRLEEGRAREEELRAQLAGAAAGQVQAVRDELEGTRRRIASLETERAAGEQIIKQYGAGVCLIQGAYAFYDESGRPLRYKDGADDHAGDAPSVLSPEGEGPMHTVEYYGTGFLVKKGGLVLTNRHVAEPWWNDTTADTLKGQGYQARLLYLRAFFPRQREPFDLKLSRASSKYDLALLHASLGGRAIPVLPLAAPPQRTVAGQPVVVVGYPTGLEAILAKAESGVVRQILESHGTDSERVTLALSRQDLIRPSTTQGHIGDITDTDIVFDAPSAQGGSGGPVFNALGQVIAVEYAVLQKFGGNSFGIPIRHARELLAQASRPPAD